MSKMHAEEILETPPRQARRPRESHDTGGRPYHRRRLYRIEEPYGPHLPNPFFLPKLPKHMAAKKTYKKKTYRRRKYYKRLPAYVDPESRRQYLLDKMTNPNMQRWGDDSIARFGQTWAKADPQQRLMRLRMGFKGHGDYKDILKWGARGLGSAIGGYFGGIPGSAQGHNYGAKFSRWMGWGGYGGDAGGNQIMAGSVETPMQVNTDSSNLEGDVFFSHREFVGNVIITATTDSTGHAVSDFAVQPYSLNAALSQTFPWLSQVAENFTLYQFEGLIFEYKPTSGEFGTTTNALGKVIMCTQYDPDAQTFISSQQMENYDYANACKPSESMMHGVETKPTQTAVNMLYTRTGLSKKDKVFTDLGLFQIGTEGVPIQGPPSTQVQQIIGELWVSYKVKLSRANLFNTGSYSSTLMDVFWGLNTPGSGTNMGYGSGAFVSTQPSASSWVTTGLANNQLAPKINNSLGCTAVGYTNKEVTIFLPQNIITGQFLITCHYISNGAESAYWITPTCNQYCALANANGFPSQISAPNVAATPNNALSQVNLITVNSPGLTQATVALTLSGVPSNQASIFISITQIPVTILQ